jgi:hypothetical protein
VVQKVIPSRAKNDPVSPFFGGDNVTIPLILFVNMMFANFFKISLKPTTGGSIMVSLTQLVGESRFSEKPDFLWKSIV